MNLSALMEHARNISIPQGGVYLFSQGDARKRFEDAIYVCNKHSVTPVVAIKALGISQFIEIASAFGKAIDVSNEAELNAVHKSGWSPNVILANGPGIGPGLASLARCGAIPVLQNEAQVRSAITSLPAGTRVGIRISSLDLIGSQNMHYESRFGLSINEAVDAGKSLTSSGLHIELLHCHYTSREQRIETYLTMLDGLTSLSQQVRGANSAQLNLGGGQLSLCHDGLGDFDELLCRINQHTNRRVMIEPGEFWLTGTISYLANVVQVVKRGSADSVLIDGSPGCALEWSESRIAASFVDGAVDSCTVELHGSTCCEFDFIKGVPVRNARLSYGQKKAPSKVLIMNVSPYSVIRARGFNGLPSPSMILLP